MICKEVNNGLDVIKSVKTSAASAHLTKKEKDVGLIYSETDCVASAVFTSNKVPAAPVIYDKNLFKKSKCFRAIIVNSGNANACNSNGFEAINEITRKLSEKLNIKQNEVFVASTGIIGEDLPYKNIVDSIDELTDSLASGSSEKLSRSMMTTDTFPKSAAVECSFFGTKFSIGAVAKGAGMIHPNMATMLSFIATDINIDQAMLSEALKYAVSRSFNRISVDGDMSTNDTVLIFSTKESENEEIKEDNELYRFFLDRLIHICTKLAKDIVKDGEGSTKLVEIIVVGAQAAEDAKNVAENVANSLLVKTAMFGNDPNWGRIVDAVGYSKGHILANKLDVFLGNYKVFSKGRGVNPENKPKIVEYMKNNKELKILINLDVGVERYNMWFSDLSYDYIKINAEYHT